MDSPPIHVLVVDDSAFMRYSLSRRLNEMPGLQVVGAARDGEEALDLIQRLDPDVVTLDVEMPGMDGLTTLREIMSHTPRPVIMLSSLTRDGTRETIQALTWGAVDFIPKPKAKANIDSILGEIVAKIRRAARARVAFIPLSQSGDLQQPKVDSGWDRPLRHQDKVVVIGTSTGGPRALSTVLAGLSADLPAALLIIQHMPAGFTHSLAERLDSLSPLSIKEADTGDLLSPGRGLLAPGGYHMTVDAEGQIGLNQKPTVHGVRPAVDVTMLSVAQRYGASSVGVVLTGMGNDGTNGAAQIHSSGGRVIAEAESTCVVWGMPRSVVEAGITDSVVPLPEVAQEIEKTVRT